MKYEKGDIDIKGLYTMNKESIFNITSPYYTELAIIKKKTNQYFRAHMLQGICNPTQPINESFIYITSSSSETYCKSSLFVVFLLHIVQSQEFSSYSSDMLQQQVFGSQKLNNHDKDQKRCWEFVLQNKNKYRKEHLLNLPQQAREDIQSKFKEKWTTIKFESKQDEQRALWHAKYTLFMLINWLPSETKIRRLRQLQGSLSPYDIEISEYRRIVQSQKKYKLQTLVIIPERPQYCITWKQIQLNYRLTSSNLMSIQQISYKLYKALRQFEERFKLSYPCLSLENVMMQMDQNMTVYLDILPMLYYQMGVPDKVLTFKDLQNCGDFQYNFWWSPSRITANMFKIISGTDELWQFIFLIDYLEKGPKSYFKTALTAADLQLRHSTLQCILKGGHQKQVFGSHAVQILSFLAEKKQITSWKQMNSRNIDIKILEQFYKTKIQ